MVAVTSLSIHLLAVSSFAFACSLRRGYLVYKNVCKACHSIKYLAFREMVGVFMTEEGAKAEAEDVSNMFMQSNDKMANDTQSNGSLVLTVILPITDWSL